MAGFEKAILLIIAAQGLLLSLALLFSFFKKKYSNFTLGIVTLILSLEILNAWAMSTSYHSSGHLFPFWSLGSYLLLPPAIYLFVKMNTQPASWNNRNLLLFFPAGLEIITEFTWFYGRRLYGISFLMEWNDPFWFAFTEVLPVLGMIAVLIYYGISLERVRKMFNSLSIRMSSTQVVRLYGLLSIFTVLTVLWFSQSLLAIQVFFYVKILVVLFIFSLAYIGYFYPEFFNTLQIPNTNTEGEDKYDDIQQLNRLKDLFERGQIYLRPRLSLVEVAAELKLPSRYISTLINTYLNNDFRGFVNDYRVNEVIRRIPQEPHKTLLAIALECGFNSKSTFNYVFKIKTGKNPSDYLKGQVLKA